MCNLDAKPVLPSDRTRTQPLPELKCIHPKREEPSQSSFISSCSVNNLEASSRCRAYVSYFIDLIGNANPLLKMKNNLRHNIIRVLAKISNHENNLSVWKRHLGAGLKRWSWFFFFPTVFIIDIHISVFSYLGDNSSRESAWLRKNWYVRTHRAIKIRDFMFHVNEKILNLMDCNRKKEIHC